MLDDLAAGEFLVLQRTVRPPRGMTIAAAGKRLDEIAAPFELGLGTGRCGEQDEQ